MDLTILIEEDQVAEPGLDQGIMMTGTEIGMDRGTDVTGRMRMCLLVADKGTSTKVVPVGAQAMEGTGTILETGTAETAEDLAPMTDDDALIPDQDRRHLVVVLPFEADEILDHPFVDLAAVPLVGPGAETDQSGRTRHTHDLLRGQDHGHFLRDQSLAPDLVRVVLGGGVTPEVQSGSPKTRVEAPVLESSQ